MGADNAGVRLDHGAVDMHYRICVKGYLDHPWQDRLEGLRIEQQEGGTRVSPDQAVLHGGLLQVIRLGLTLLSAADERGCGT